MKEQKNRVTIGLDLGDRRHRFCVLDGRSEVVEEGSVLNKRAALSALVKRYRAALVVMDAGCQSPWISRYLEQLGAQVIVSNPRRVRAIYQHERKSDRRDALMQSFPKILMALKCCFLQPGRAVHRAKRIDFGNQMARFLFLRRTLDLSLDQPLSPHGSTIPLAANLFKAITLLT